MKLESLFPTLYVSSLRWPKKQNQVINNYGKAQYLGQNITVTSFSNKSFLKTKADICANGAEFLEIEITGPSEDARL